MIQWLKYKLEFKKLTKARQKVVQPYLDEIRLLQKKGKKEEADILLSEMRMEAQFLDFDIESLTTRYLRQIAWRNDIPIPGPGEEEAWEELFMGAGKTLSTRGKSTLRNAIRGERKARREPFMAWGLLITGLMSAATGLTAVLAK